MNLLLALSCICVTLAHCGVGVESSPHLTPPEARDLWMRNPPLQAAVKYLRYIPNGMEVLRDSLSPLIPSEAESGWDAMLRDVEKLVENGREDNSTENTCQLCQAAVTGLVLVARNVTEWDDVEEIVVDACLALLLAIDPNVKAEAMCDGIIGLQGPVVFNILKSLNTGIRPDRPNIESYCESFNLCFPPGESTCPGQPPKKSPRKEKPHHVDFQKLFQQKQERIFDEVFGPKKRNKRDLEGALKVVQLTDVHLDPLYAEGSPTDCGMFVCCRDEYSGEGESNKWGDYKCNTPQATVNLFLEKAGELQPNFIIYSGDTPPHSMWEETQESQMRCSELLVESLEATLPGYRVYPNIGNHEMYPTNLYYRGTDDTDQMAEDFANLWSSFANFTSSQMETMKQGSYFTSEVMPGLRIISFNTNYWYSYNWYNVYSECEDHVEAMYEFIENTLAEAQTAGEKVILIGHHPPGKGDMMVAHTRRFTDFTVQYKDIIVLHVAGHTHNDEFRLVRHGENDAEGLVLVSPSITPIGRINPSARLFYLDPTDFTLIDYDQFYFDIVEAIENPGEEPEIKLAYRATEEYGLDDLTPASFQDLAERLSTEDELIHKYHHNYYGQTGRGGECDGECRTGHVCSAAYSNYDDSQYCMNNANFPEPEPPSPPEPTDPGLASTRDLPGLFLLAVMCLLHHFL